MLLKILNGFVPFFFSFFISFLSFFNTLFLQSSFSADFMVTISVNETSKEGSDYLLVLYLVDDYENEKVRYL